MRCFMWCKNVLEIIEASENILILLECLLCITDNNDDNLFSSLLTNGHDVLKQLLPDKTNYQCNLRNRRHNLSLTVKTDARNFVVR